MAAVSGRRWLPAVSADLGHRRRCAFPPLTPGVENVGTCNARVRGACLVGKYIKGASGKQGRSGLRWTIPRLIFPLQA